ncbi:MAG: hypothetical protein ACLQFR_18835 [Streptosporangiaceae bacterium]
MGLLAEAYNAIFDDGPSRSFATFGENINYPMHEHDMARLLAQPPTPKAPRPPDARPLAKQLTVMTKAVQQMQRALRIMALGIDYRRFARFEQLTPHIAWYADGHQERLTQPGYDPTAEEFEYCRQFLVTVALRMAELQVHIARPHWWTGQ